MGFVTARRKLDPELARSRDLAELERHLRRATETKARCDSEKLQEQVYDLQFEAARYRIALNEIIGLNGKNDLPDAWAIAIRALSPPERSGS